MKVCYVQQLADSSLLLHCFLVHEGREGPATELDGAVAIAIVDTRTHGHEPSVLVVATTRGTHGEPHFDPLVVGQLLAGVMIVVVRPISRDVLPLRVVLVSRAVEGLRVAVALPSQPTCSEVISDQ